MKYFLPLVLIVLIIFIPDRNGGFYFNKDLTSFLKNDFSIVNFGDVMFDRGVRNIIENRGRDPFEYFKKDLNLFGDYDVFLVNLEGPIVEMDRSLCQQKAYNFQFATNTPKKLKEVGVNMVNIANNHSYDCFKSGFEATKRYLQESDIAFMGDDSLESSFIVKEIDGKRVAFVGIDETVQIVPLSGFYSLVKRLDAENDLVIVNIHWGKEYELQNDINQQSTAHKLIDSGVDVIFGHHPHVVQNLEVYKDKTIFYSLGNFVFDQNFGDTTIGLGVGAKFKENKTEFELFPFNIKVFAPDLMNGQEKLSFCSEFLKNVKHNNCEFDII